MAQMHERLRPPYWYRSPANSDPNVCSRGGHALSILDGCSKMCPPLCTPKYYTARNKAPRKRAPVRGNHQMPSNAGVLCTCGTLLALYGPCELLLRFLASPPARYVTINSGDCCCLFDRQLRMATKITI